MTRCVRLWPPRKSARRAFTLIELLLVVVILAILASIVVPRFAKRSEQARQSAAKTAISMMKTALAGYEVDCGHYPTTQEGLGALLQQPTGASNWSGPYLEHGSLNDPWGNPFRYNIPGNDGQPFEIISFGADGRPGGSGDDADISSTSLGK